MHYGRGFADDRSDFRGSGIFRSLFVLGVAGRADKRWGSLEFDGTAGQAAKHAAMHGAKRGKKQADQALASRLRKMHEAAQRSKAP